MQTMFSYQYVTVRKMHYFTSLKVMPNIIIHSSRKLNINPMKINKRFTHSGKGGGISKLVVGITNALSRPTAPIISVSRPLTSIGGKSAISRFPNATREFDHFLRDESLYRCLEILYKTPEDRTNDDLAVLRAFHTHFMNLERSNNRYFQVGFEVALKNKNFLIEDVMALLPKSFKLIDLLNLNEDKVHQSTIFTILQCCQLVSQPGFKTDIEANIVIQTVLKKFNLNQIDSDRYQFIVDSNKATGNTICDLKLNGHCYDYKFNLDSKIPLGRNILMSVQSYNEAAFVKFITEWQNRLIFVERTRLNDLPKNAIDYYRSLYTKVKAIDEDPTLTPIEKVQTITVKIFRSST
jgi:hypothetical protein